MRDEDDAGGARSHSVGDAITRDELVEPLVAALDRAELVDEAAGALARYGNRIIPEIERRLRDIETPQDIRRELPAVLVRIGTAEAEQALIGSLLQADVTLRHRVIASLNKLRTVASRGPPRSVDHQPAARGRDRRALPLVSGARAAQGAAQEDDPVLQAMHHAMDQELDRIFRLMALLLPHVGLHDAYVGLRSSDELVRANSLELLDNVLEPELRQLLVPLLDRRSRSRSGSRSPIAWSARRSIPPSRR